MSQNVIVLIGRILLSIMFIMSGFGKLADPTSTAGMITGAGWPAPTALAYLAGLFELVAGIAVLVGFQTRIASYLLAAFALVTGLVFHSGAINVPDFPAAANGLLTVFNQIMMMKNITIAGAFLVLAAFGPGALSVDARTGKVLATA
ncbi:DoxX family protein [Sinorhizobium terangae]|uniref:DoxX family membrane protein n=1 Tax=Sinorhizobium terangae TaxID=110322 RepID=A0A6N7LBC5_SINTE|nr:DoxX family protein [Sinorhizobium terangae]MBB4183810.1 putative oxidoreductase [Sinorhizobium terangae]MQX15163.1 DoxX family membrane protein [Sinorhizobium terangae]WFU47950.1 DoxX family protein [Sinorhizobium terangae]